MSLLGGEGQLQLPRAVTKDYLPLLQNEWYEFKVLSKGKKMAEPLKLTQQNKNRYPILGFLLSIVSVLPISTVCCERGFSLMNIIKHNCRSSTEMT